jgi:phage head maturation protease
VLADGTATDNEQAVAVCYSLLEEHRKQQGATMEYKNFPAVVTATNEAEGIAETVFAVFGNIDGGRDVAHPGSFSKTFAERGNKVRVLDHHNARSVLSVVGKPIELRELRRDELPPEILLKYPEASGGAYAKVKFLMDTPEGRGVFIRLRDQAVDEWSFGYDALDVDYSKAIQDGEEVVVRNLRTVKLYEISPVIWGMNDATMTTNVKADDEADSEIKNLLDEATQRARDVLAQLQNVLDEAAKVSPIETDSDDADSGAGPEPPPTPPDEAEPPDEPALTPEQEARRQELLSLLGG